VDELNRDGFAVIGVAKTSDGAAPPMPLLDAAQPAQQFAAAAAAAATSGSW
jgi:hypothetical protein